MLVYEQFVFVHTPKTAGIFLSEALRHEFPPPVKVLETHAGWDAIPPEAAGRPVLMYVRNPWDWYVSWYLFWTLKWLPGKSSDWARRNPWVRLLFGEEIEVTPDGLRGVNDFATTLRIACESLDPSSPAMAKMIRDGAPHAESIEAGDDFYTARFKQLAGAGLGSDLLTVGRYESLLADLDRFFARNGIPLGDGVLDRIATRDPVNVNDRRPYREYYDDELRDLVGRSCSMLIEGFDYRF